MNNLPSLDDFLKNDSLYHAYVSEPGFSILYLRKGSKHIVTDKGGKYYENVLQIANCTTDTGEEFVKLIEKLESKWGGPIFVERNVALKFIVGLLRLGFSPVDCVGGIEGNFVKRLPL